MEETWIKLLFTYIHMEETCCIASWCNHACNLKKVNIPNLDCLSSTYPGTKNPRGLSHGRAGPRARAGSAGPRGPHPYSPYPRGLRAGPRARTTGAPNPPKLPVMSGLNIGKSPWKFQRQLNCYTSDTTSWVAFDFRLDVPGGWK